MRRVTRRGFLKAGGAVSAAVLAAPALLGSSCGGSDPEVVRAVTAEERIGKVLGRMTLDEKLQMVHGAWPQDLADAYVPPLPRLDVPGLRLVYGTAGIRFRGPATAFPASIAVAATWDKTLAREAGEALGSEAKAKGHDVLLAPAVDIYRVPVGGRAFESYGEDPYLASRMAVESVGGVQSQGIIAAVGRFAAHTQEEDRASVSANVSERSLREIYLLPFEAVVREAGAGAVVAASNRVNGTFCTEHERLLTEILKDEWGFEGFVVAEEEAMHATTPAANAGLDLEMPVGNFFGEALRRAIDNGEVSEATLDDKVRRILRQMARSGALDGRKKGRPGAYATPEHRALAREVAASGIVLLKRDNETLPLDAKKVESIAVIGAGASVARVGGGGTSEVEAPYSVGILEGIRSRAEPGVSVEFSDGTTGDLGPVPPEALAPPGDRYDEVGIWGEYYDDAALSGAPVFSRLDERVGADALAAGTTGGALYARWRGELTVADAGEYTFALTGNGESSLYLDDERVISNRGGRTIRTGTYAVGLDAGQTYNVRVEYANESGREAAIRFEWRTPYGRNPVELARSSDVAVVVATDHDAQEMEDREGLALPGDQDRLISDVAAANSRTVVVLVTGGPVLMPWIDEVANVLEAWYPGMEEGNAIASVLFGEVNPSGRLPVTFGRRPEDYPANTRGQYPGTDGRAGYLEEVFVGYRHFDEQEIEPLFPFGHGLSYASFSYRRGSIRTRRSPGLAVEVEVEIENTGSTAGAEVVQLYVAPPDAGVPAPPKQLRGFEKIFLKPGETGSASFDLDERALSYWDDGSGGWVRPKGVYRLMVGGSSRDLRLTGEMEL